jgi:hypothetical protein
MSNTRPMEYFQEQFGSTQTHKLTFLFQITAAKVVALKPQGLGAVLSSFDAVTQAQIDALLGSTNEFTAAKFDATSMGANAFAVLANCAGQVKKLVAAKASLYSGTDNQTTLNTVTMAALVDSQLASQASVSALGNVAAKFNLGAGADALTSGVIIVEFEVILK